MGWFQEVGVDQGVGGSTGGSGGGGRYDYIWNIAGIGDVNAIEKERGRAATTKIGYAISTRMARAIGEEAGVKHAFNLRHVGRAG